jgi:hypothetical protein
VRSPAGIRRLERNVRRLRLYVFQLIYKVTGPWHAPNCFATALDLIQKKSDLRLNDAKLVHQASHLPVKSHTFPLKHMSVCLNC